MYIHKWGSQGCHLMQVSLYNHNPTAPSSHQLITTSNYFLLWNHDLKNIRICKNFLTISVLRAQFKKFTMNGIFRSAHPNFVSHKSNLIVKKGYILISRALRWCHKFWLVRSHCPCSKRAYVILSRLPSLWGV